MQVFSFEQSKAVTDDSTRTRTHGTRRCIRKHECVLWTRAQKHTHTLSSPGCGGWHLTPEGPAGLSRRLNGELSSFTNPAAHIPHSHPPSLSKTLQRTHTRARMDTQTHFLPSLHSAIHPSCVLAVPFPPSSVPLVVNGLPVCSLPPSSTLCLHLSLLAQWKTSRPKSDGH